MTTSLTPESSAIDIPELPDRARMRRETAARLRSAGHTLTTRQITK